MKSLKLLALSGLVLFALTSCDSTDDTKKPVVVPKSELPTAVLTNIGNNVILPTYKLLNEKANEMHNAVVAFSKDRTEANLNKCRDAWRAARIPWEQSEAFLFGPADEQGLDPAMDEWPVDKPGMDAIINSNKPITPDVIASNDNTRGFHLMEYLLWGTNGDKKVREFSDREVEYLVAASLDVYQSTTSLNNTWKDYVNNFILAGKNDPKYKKFPSTFSAIMEMVTGDNGIVAILDEVGNEKIENPLNGEGDDKDGNPHLDLEESRFAHNSKTDYINNIESVSNLYLGSFNGHKGPGISDLVVNIIKDKALDEKIKSQIKKAQKAIENIPGTFTAAIQDPKGREIVKTAQNEVIILKDLFDKDLKDAIDKHKDKL